MKRPLKSSFTFLPHLPVLRAAEWEELIPAEVPHRATVRTTRSKQTIDERTNDEKAGKTKTWKPLIRGGIPRNFFRTGAVENHEHQNKNPFSNGFVNPAAYG